jgi:hypothetical protein
VKNLKVIYIIALSICAIELLLFFFGSNDIFYSIKDILFKQIKGNQTITISAIYNVDNNYNKILKMMIKVNTFAYFLSLIGGCLSSLFYKLDRRKKYIIGIGFFVASLIFSLITGPIWNHLLQKNYL